MGSPSQQKVVGLLTGIAAGQAVSLALLVVALIGLFGMYAALGEPGSQSAWVNIFTFGFAAFAEAFIRIILWMLIMAVVFMLLVGGGLMAWVLGVRSSAVAGRDGAPGSAQALGWTLVGLGGLGILQALGALASGAFALLPLLWSAGAITSGILLANAAADWKRERMAQARGWQPVPQQPR